MTTPAAALHQSTWFSQLPEEYQTGLLAIGKSVQLKAGEWLFSRGDKPCGVYVVLSGTVRVSGISENGKEAVLSICQQSQWFGEIALFDNKERTHDAKAETDCTLWQLPHLSLQSLLDQHPQLWRYFGQLLGQKLRQTFKALEDIQLLPAPTRIARRLLVLIENENTVNSIDSNRIHLPQDTLGAMLGISRQTTNQILKGLQQQNVISLERGYTIVLNKQALQTIANQS